MDAGGWVSQFEEAADDDTDGADDGGGDGDDDDGGDGGGGDGGGGDDIIWEAAEHDEDLEAFDQLRARSRGVSADSESKSSEDIIIVFIVIIIIIMTNMTNSAIIIIIIIIMITMTKTCNRRQGVCLSEQMQRGWHQIGLSPPCTNCHLKRIITITTKALGIIVISIKLLSLRKIIISIMAVIAVSNNLFVSGMSVETLISYDCRHHW